MNNKLLKTILISFGILILLSAVFFFIPFDDLWQKLPFVNQFSNNTSLVIETPNSQATVTINGEDYGETPLLSEDFAPGSYEVELDRISTSEDNFYMPATFVIELSNNTEAYINMEIGPADTKSGYMAYYTPAPFGDSEAYITLSSDIPGTEVSLDGQLLGETPISLTKISAGEHNLILSAVGYEDLAIPVLATEDFNLNVNAFLFPIPVNLVPAINEEG